ncbi:phage tail assembly chaperone [Pseudomonas sp. CJQ_13]|uniref:phage tail assembly chaperone n=1 Tax=Pseudomonas sp. CJQ_13 TaxID=3367170 RepID=UPI00370B026B
MKVYGTHPLTREYVGSFQADADPLDPDFWLIPAYAYTDEPPDPKGGQAVRRTFAGDAWELVSDHRGVVYETLTGAAVQHDELGELPENLTSLPCPGPFFVWSGGGWALDEVEQQAAESATERAWRDECLAKTDYLAMPDYPLTEAARAEVIAYRQALRDWPEGGEFPLVEHRPLPPSWLPEKVQ